MNRIGVENGILVTIFNFMKLEFYIHHLKSEIKGLYLKVIFQCEPPIREIFTASWSCNISYDRNPASKFEKQTVPPLR